ncbi:MAG: thiamine pyrophosphate-binding protein [Nitrospinota bacterium]|nr:thiamine pyrophosphate-binding protein [Nitrospinota bacterium]
MPKMTGARFFAEALQAYGVSYVFFMPGIVKRALFEMDERTNIQRILTHGEKSAVYMADGYARACGRPGICMAQTVGTSNLAAGLRDPYLGCSPVVAITGGTDPQTHYRNVYQEVEDFSIFEPVTKFNVRVEHVERYPDLLREAFRVATSGTPGPVHLELMGTGGQLTDNAEGDLEVLVDEATTQVPAFRPEPEPGSIQEAARLLGAAKNPIIVAGGGVRASGAGPELVELAEKLSIPIATALNAKDTVPADHPLSVGVVGVYSRETANRAVLDSDLVFFVGSQTGGQVTNRWRLPRIGTPVIQLDINPEELGRNYPLKAAIMGDAKVSLRKLTEAADAATAPSRGEWTERAKTSVKEWYKEFESLMNSDAVPIRPERICKDLTDRLPPDALLVADTGHAGMWTGGMVDLTEPGQGFIRCAGSLGWGLPAVLGAKCALPDRPVVLFTGDGGFWYHLAEVETAVRRKINAVILINNNGALSHGLQGLAAIAGGELHGNHEEIWQYDDTDFAKVAESMGALGIRVDKPSEIGSALDQAFSADRPVVVDVATDVMAMAPLAIG